MRQRRLNRAASSRRSTAACRELFPDAVTSSSEPCLTPNAFAAQPAQVILLRRDASLRAPAHSFTVRCVVYVAYIGRRRRQVEQRHRERERSRDIRERMARVQVGDETWAAYRVALGATPVSLRVYRPAAKAAGVTGDLRVYRIRGSFVSLPLWEGRSLTFVADKPDTAPPRSPSTTPECSRSSKTRLESPPPRRSGRPAAN